MSTSASRSSRRVPAGSDGPVPYAWPPTNRPSSSTTTRTRRPPTGGRGRRGTGPARHGNARRLPARVARALIDAAAQHYGGLDVLVHNAAGLVRGPLADAADDDYAHVFDLNARATFVALRGAGRRKHDGGRIVYVSSVATKLRSRAVTEASAGADNPGSLRTSPRTAGRDCHRHPPRGGHSGGVGVDRDAPIVRHRRPARHGCMHKRDGAGPPQRGDWLPTVLTLHLTSDSRVPSRVFTPTTSTV
ncbi:SDR family NAD(P)-dependent oxidoreductase [Embleya sp. NPDC059237]|uniref:SDR family NAD(P)-dependent oxidoreductase n=1 Tax=Embleya sp. NPDC059237 TaxID=3346784 RepID=UPI0036B9BB39